jgi:CPA1 family monovalent cation:H+ antiporter
MILGGIIIGICSGIIFSKLLSVFRRYHQYLAILIIITSAYSAYLVTELVQSYLFPASAIIATIFSTFIIGNYGRYKIDIKTEELAQSLFAFIAFLINSTIFILVGASIMQINTSLLPMLGWIIPLAVLCVIIGRAVSIYFPMRVMNLFENEGEKTPKSWQHILAWGSLRGGLALALVAIVPENLTFVLHSQVVPIRDFLLILVITSVFFSIFIKTLSLESLIKKLGINNLSLIEKIEEEESKLITITSMLGNIENLHEQKYLSDREHESLIELYTKRRSIILQNCKLLAAQSPTPHSAFLKIASLYALALERHYAKELYAHGDITEKPLKKFLAIIDRQTYRLRSGKTQVREIFQESYKNDFFEWTE